MKVCTSTSPSRAPYVSSAGGADPAPAVGVARIARRHAGSSNAPSRFGIAARRSPWADGSPMNASVPPGVSTRWNSARALSSPGRWCSTACPSTRSNDPSGNGSDSASACRASTSTPSSSAVRPAARACPGRCLWRPRARSRPDGPFRLKYPVPAPISSAERSGRRPAQRLRQLAQHLPARRSRRSRWPTSSRSRARQHRGSGCSRRGSAWCRELGRWLPSKRADYIGAYNVAPRDDLLQRNQPPGVRPGVDRRAHAPRRAGGELLVPASSRGLPLDRCSLRGSAGRGHGVWRGIRLGRAGRACSRGDGRGREPRGA